MTPASDRRKKDFRDWIDVALLSLLVAAAGLGVSILNNQYEAMNKQNEALNAIRRDLSTYQVSIESRVTRTETLLGIKNPGVKPIPSE